jgi:hypothetical protein
MSQLATERVLHCPPLALRVAAPSARARGELGDYVIERAFVEK